MLLENDDRRILRVLNRETFGRVIPEVVGLFFFVCVPFSGEVGNASEGE